MSTDLATSSSRTDSAPSMRLRIAVSLALLALAVIIVQSLLLIWFLDHKEEEFIEHQLGQQIEHSMSVWRKSPDAAFPNTPSMWLYRIDKQNASGEVAPTFASLAVGEHEIFIGDTEYHVAVREDESARYILAYDVGDHESRLDSLVLITLLGSGLLGLFTLIAGYLLAGHLTRRLDRLAIQVANDGPGSFCAPKMESELLAVAQALDQSRDRQVAALERERLFGANLAHELRTPLTAIRTDAELLAALSGVPDGVARRGARIVTAVDRINALANSLLLLARDARPVSSEQIDLRMALLEVWSSLQLAAPNGSGLQLDIPENYMLQADPALLDLVLRNVLDNAQRYNDEGDIRCELNGSVLRISDNGQGFAEEDLARIFDRYYIGSRGVNGLGLALVQHICQACGWQVSAGNSAHGGGWVSIDFAASVLAA